MHLVKLPVQDKIPIICHHGTCLVDRHSKFNHYPQLLSRSSAHWVRNWDDLHGNWIPLCHWFPRFFESFNHNEVTCVASHNLLGQAASITLDEIEISMYFTSTSMVRSISGWQSRSRRVKAYCSMSWRAWKEMGIPNRFRVFFHSLTYSLHSIGNCRTTSNSLLSFSTITVSTSILASSAVDTGKTLVASLQLVFVRPLPLLVQNWAQPIIRTWETGTP